MLCYVMFCHVMSCYVMLCHVMLCHVMLYYIKNVSIHITLLTVGLTVGGSEKKQFNCYK